MNANYRRGRAKEYRCCNKLKKEGFDLVQRTAGSHSEVDVLAIKIDTKEIKFIQCKPKSMGVKAKQRIIDRNKGLNGKFICSFEVI